MGNDTKERKSVLEQTIINVQVVTKFEEKDDRGLREIQNTQNTILPPLMYKPLFVSLQTSRAQLNSKILYQLKASRGSSSDKKYTVASSHNIIFIYLQLCSIRHYTHSLLQLKQYKNTKSNHSDWKMIAVYYVNVSSRSASAVSPSSILLNSRKCVGL